MKLVTIGDSIVKGTCTPQGGSIPDKVANPNFSTILKDKLFADELINYGTNGISFSSLSPVLPEDSLAKTIIDKETGDITVIAAGTNDFGTNVPLGEITDTGDVSFCGAVDYVFGVIKEKAQGNKVFVVTPIPRADEDKNEKGYSLNDYRNVLAQLAKKYKFTVIDGKTFPIDVKNKEIRFKYMTDGTHPNEETHGIYADWLLESIRRNLTI